MRALKQRKYGAARFFVITALALASPALIHFARVNSDTLSIAGERAAIFSAALNMPDSGLSLIKERFRSELYGESPSPTPAPDKTMTGESAPESSAPIEAEDAQNEPEIIPDEGTNTAKPPKIPAKYTGELVSENFAGREGGTLISFGAGFIKNDTKKSDAAINEILEESFDLGFTETGEPQVLLLHTHATESFERYDNTVYDTRNTWRSTDNNNNMAAVGSAMQQVLEEEGIEVLHDTTQHDYPSYNGSYERSAKTITKYLEEYPSIKVVLDLHRDAMERENQAIVKPVAVIDGRKAAQIMIISGCDDGSMNMPSWYENLRFAAAFQDSMERMYPDLTRPVYLCYRKYNMDLSNGSLLLEFGSNANTLDEAVYSAQLAGKALAGLIKENLSVEQEN